VTILDSSKYHSSSMDELVLVKMCRDCGVVSLTSKTETEITLTVNGDKEVYKVLKVQEFSSDTKMMSVTV